MSMTNALLQIEKRDVSSCGNILLDTQQATGSLKRKVSTDSSHGGVLDSGREGCVAHREYHAASRTL